MFTNFRGYLNSSPRPIYREMSAFPSLENRSLKKKSDCPPDVYNQRDEQKEDLMSEDFVRDGYKYIKPVRDEYDSCRKESKFLTVNDSLWKFYHDVLAKKYDCSTYQDLKKKSASNVRETIVPVVDKNQANAWFRELAGSTPLQILGRRVPYSKDKQEILSELVAHKVPISRAVWLINLILLHTPAQPENAKRKQRPTVHPSEWTSNICQMLERNLVQLCSESGEQPSVEEDWDYLFTLLLALYDSDVADHWEVLLWLTKRAESLWKQPSEDEAAPTQQQYSNYDNNSDEPLPTETIEETNVLNNVKFFLFYLLKFGRRFTENELIARRLLFWCCGTFRSIVLSESRVPAADNQAGNHPNNPEMQLILEEYLETCSCPLHRSVVLSLSSMITCLILSCPSAAVWNSIPTGTDHSYLEGSPLDVIPYSTAALPMPRGPETTEIRQCLFDVENVIITRSQLAEVGWNRQAFTDVSGEEMERLIKVLDILDRQDYHSVKEHNPMEALFNRIFNDDAINVDTAILVTTLCEWAVSVHRVGIYRSVIVACLLEQLTHSFESDPNPFQMLQQTLLDFLDTFSSSLPPYSTDRALVDNEPMRNLVCLFAELIDREVFDHDIYVRRMIARGVFAVECHPLAASAVTESHTATLTFSTSTHGKFQAVSNTTLLSNLPNNVTTQCSVASEMSEDNDRCSVDNPDSVRSEVGFPSVTTSCCGYATSAPHHPASESLTGPARCSPHFHYLTHFPLPQDESYSHEENQRYQLLYGSLRARDRARSRIRQLVRDIVKIFTRKFYLIDVVHGEMCKRKKSKDREREVSTAPVANMPSSSGHRVVAVSATGGGSGGVSDDAHLIDKLHEDIMSRFICLSYHDMECVISQCTPTFTKVLSGCNGQGNPTVIGDDYHSSSTLGMANPPSPPNNAGIVANLTSQSTIYMPVPNSIFLFFELIETSLNITSLIATIVDTLERLQTLFESRTPFMTLYMSSVCLRSIGILQRHQPVLFTMSDLPNRLFPALIAQVRQVREPTQCGPFERCVLAYLNDLFTSNAQIKSHFASIYNKAHPKVAALFRSVEPSEGLATFDQDYASDLLKAAGSDYPSLFRAYADDLRNNPNSRFSFVCRAIIFVCQATTLERVNYLCGLCAELTSHCGDLTPEWLGALYAVIAPRPYDMAVLIIAPRPYRHGYGPIVSDVEPGDMNMYDSVSSLIGTLLFRRCMTISDFLCRVICPAMAQGLVQPVGPQLEPSIRLACHILHRLFTAESSASTIQANMSALTPGHEPSASAIATANTTSTSATDLSTPPFRISEPLLLTGALQKVTPELLVDVLKMLMVHNDKACSEDLVQSGMHMGDDATEGSDSDVGQADDEAHDEEHSHRRFTGGKAIHPIVRRFLESGILPTVIELRNLPLIGLIQLVLREICSVPWVRERFFRMPSDRWTRENVLIDRKFSPTQARRLLHVIFHPFDLTWSDTSSLATAMCQVLSSLDLWTLRCALVKFQLLYTQIRLSQQKDVLDSVGQAIVRGFQTQALNWLKANGSGMSADVCLAPIGGISRFELEENDPVWLVPALIAKLPRQLKAQIVTGALEILQGIKHFWKHKNDEDKEGELLKHSIVLAHPAFFRLLQVCMAEIDPVDKLYEQVGYFVENAHDTEDRVPDNLRTRQVVQECLRLRLTLVGQCFKALQKEHEPTTDWSLLLTKLISHGVIEPESNTTLFYMVYDMLQSLVHTMAARSGVEGKHYQNLAKKIRRELSRRPSYGIEQIRLLLPPLKAACTVIVTGHNAQRLSASGSSGTSDGGGSGSGANKSGGIGKVSTSKGAGKGGGSGHHGGPRDSAFRRPGKKRGFTIIGKERLAPWDLQDPSKQAILLSMHGATSIEAIPSRTEEQANRLIRHDHFIRLRRPPEFYLTPVYPEEEDAKAQDKRSDATEQPTLGPPPSKSFKMEANTTDSGMLPPSTVSAKSSSNPLSSSYNLGPISSDGNLRATGTKPRAPSTINEPKGGTGRGVDRTCTDSLIYEELRRPPTTNSSNKPAVGLSEFTFDPAVAATPQLPPSSAYGARSFQPDYQQSYQSSVLQRSRQPEAPFVNAAIHSHGAASSQFPNSMVHAERFSMDNFHTQPKRRTSNADKNFSDGFTPGSDMPGSHHRPRGVPNKLGGDHVLCADSVPTDSTPVGSGATMAPAVTTKRKRGSGRRGSSSAGINEHGLYGTVGQRNMNQGPSGTSARTGNTLGHKVSNSNSLAGHPMHGHPGSTSELGMMDVPPGQDPSGMAWLGKTGTFDKPTIESQPSRSSTSMDSLRGFMRNRMQQQRASAAALQQQQQQQNYSSFMNPTVAQSSIRSSEHSEMLPGGSVYGQSSDIGAGIPYSSSVHNLNAYPSSEVTVVGTYSQQPTAMNPTHLIEQPIRQVGSGNNLTRYVTQFNSQRPGGMGMHPSNAKPSVQVTHQLQQQTQQIVPNPPPYPISAQQVGASSTHQMQSNQQHSFNRAPVEDNYVVVLENQVDEQSFPRMGAGQPMMRHSSYPTGMMHQAAHPHQHQMQHQQISGEPVSIQLMHHPPAGSYTRIADPSQLHPSHMTQSMQQAAQQQSQYSRYTNY
ncbi:hypothetical protein T265_10348 [Opisthorchis viverrini]|uniref:Mediator complex subunit Med12 domain-containing protein n=1 Tax=Opisthorchis viverrini TaxID=6198 RepID=A0A074Z6U9_OPIVI|nr:hypothetical protein T265_10348 [Opisthorchis viverrini]KER21287.1 hypothetical protein T265_10348 [Opisthorchis viverrini]